MVCWRAQVLRLAPSRHVLAFALHHIIADGWSLGILLDDLEHAYRNALTGETPLLPPATFQYRDYVADDQRLYRPAEVNILQGNASKALKTFGWSPSVRFQGLVKEMVAADCEAFKNQSGHS